MEEEMPRKIRPRECACGCGDMTRGGEFCPGHDAKLQSAIIEKVGGVVELRRVVEKALKCRIRVKHD
jgi:hypothetical protein